MVFFGAGLMGLYDVQSSLFGSFSAAQFQAAQAQQVAQPIHWKLWEPHTQPTEEKSSRKPWEAPPVAFIDELRTEIDDWIKLN